MSEILPRPPLHPDEVAGEVSFEYCVEGDRLYLLQPPDGIIVQSPGLYVATRR